MEHTIDMQAIVDRIRAAGAFAYIEHTGGGVATIYASADENPNRPGLPSLEHVYPCDVHVGHDPGAQAIAGPGWFDQDPFGRILNPSARGDLSDFYVGPDDQGENHPYATTPDDTEDTIAQRMLDIIRDATF